MLKDSYSALADAVVILDQSNTLSWCNPAAMTLLGIRSDLDIGKPFNDLIRNETLANYLREDTFLNPIEVDAPTIKNVPLEVRAASFSQGLKVVFFHNTEFIKGLVWDRKDFVSSISHELRTPLTVIRGYLDALDEILSSQGPTVSKAIEQMREQSSRMEILLRDLLTLSQLEVMADVVADEQEYTNLSAMLESIRENALTACSSRRKITLDFGELKKAAYKARITDLESVFSNLIFNAVNYTDDGGQIDIRLYLTEDFLVFEVEDDGIGIGTEDLPRLTDLFFRTEESRSSERCGCGLGLAIVKLALRLLEGDLVITSELGKGSIFRCLLSKNRLRIVD